MNMRRKQMMCAVAVAAVFSLLAAGCGTKGGEETTTEPTLTDPASRVYVDSDSTQELAEIDEWAATLSIDERDGSNGIAGNSEIDGNNGIDGDGGIDGDNVIGGDDAAHRGNSFSFTGDFKGADDANDTLTVAETGETFSLTLTVGGKPYVGKGRMVGATLCADLAADVAVDLAADQTRIGVELIPYDGESADILLTVTEGGEALPDTAQNSGADETPDTAQNSVPNEASGAASTTAGEASGRMPLPQLPEYRFTPR